MSTEIPTKLPTNIEYARIPHYKVNLDDPAQTRWNHVIEEYIDILDEIWKTIDKFLNELFHPILLHMAVYICSLLIFLRLFPHSDEFIGIAKVVNKSPGELGLMHISYEITSFCTSVLINDKSIFGTTINLRTMDWSQPFDLRKITIKIHFVNNNDETLYTSVMFVGAVGIVTALKPNKFGIVVNFRNSAYNNVNEYSYITLKTIFGFVCNFCMIFIGGWTVTSLIRYICDNAKDYDEAVQMASDKWLIAPAFITITGTELNQGVVVTRDRLRCVDKNILNADKEYIVQCNCDHWMVGTLNDYSDIYDSKERVEIAHHMLPVLLEESERKEIDDTVDIIDSEYEDVILTDAQLEFIWKCWRFLCIDPIRNEETVYSNIIIPKYNLILSAKTTIAFEPVSAKEFREMFYLSSSNVLEQNKTK